jgi:hypothetical protein
MSEQNGSPGPPPAIDMTLQLGRILFAALQSQNGLIFPFTPLIHRTRRGRRYVSDETGYVEHRDGIVLLKVPDDVLVAMRANEETSDLFLIARVRRSFVDEVTKEKSPIVRPTIVGADGRPM